MKLRNTHTNLLVKHSTIFSVWVRKWWSFIIQMGCGCEAFSKVCKAASLVLFPRNIAVKGMKSWARQFLLCFEVLHGCWGVKTAVKPFSQSDFYFYFLRHQSGAALKTVFINDNFKICSTCWQKPTNKLYPMLWNCLLYYYYYY